MTSIRGPGMLVAAMERAQLSSRDVAELFLVNDSTVSRWLTGERTPGLEMAVAIERRLGVPVEAWAEGEVDNA